METRSQPQFNQILYDQDFYLWIQTTAKLLKERSFDDVDWENLIEELRKYQLSADFFPAEPPFTLEDVLNPDDLPQ